MTRIEAIRPGQTNISKVESAWKSCYIGRPDFMSPIIQHIEIFEQGLAVPERPVLNTLLLGPTGSGKTYFVESLAQALHGRKQNVLRVDCGEYQLDHEVAKLIGAPPGYLGHRETQPVFSQQKLNAVASERSGISIVLFDEIEKAAPSFRRLLLGILDRAQLKLGDNTVVNFERTMIFLTSNLGAEAFNDLSTAPMGFGGSTFNFKTASGRVTNAVKREFPPEFINRLDEHFIFQPLSQDEIVSITSIIVEDYGRHLLARLGSRAPKITISVKALEHLAKVGYSAGEGARCLKRAVRELFYIPITRILGPTVPIPGPEISVTCPDSELVFETKREQFQTADVF